jgi:hypothetical protein
MQLSEAVNFVLFYFARLEEGRGSVNIRGFQVLIFSPGRILKWYYLKGRQLFGKPRESESGSTL